nr:coat protein [Cactus mild mottle virus]
MAGSYTNVKPNTFVFRTQSWVEPEKLLNYLTQAQLLIFQTQQARTQLANELQAQLRYGPRDNVRFPTDTFLINTATDTFAPAWFALAQACDTKDRIFEVGDNRGVTSAETKLATQRVDDATIAIRNAIRTCINLLITADDIYDRTTFENATGWLWQVVAPSTAQTRT